MDEEKWIQVSVADVTTQVGKTRVDQAEQGSAVRWPVSRLGQPVLRGRAQAKGKAG